MKRYSIRLTLLLVLFAVTITVGGWCAMRQLWFSTLLAGVVALWVGVALYRMQTTMIAMMQRLVDAVRFNDTACLFHSPYADKEMEQLARSLTTTVKEFNHRLQDEEMRRTYYETMLDRVDTAVLVINHAGMIEWMNRPARMLLGERSVLPDVLMEESDNPVRRLRLSSEAGSPEMAVSTTRMTLKGATLRLITLKNIQTVVEQTEMEAWQKLIRVLTHEIMNSITPIISLSETLGQSSSGEESPAIDRNTLQQAMQTIHRRSRGLLGFVENYRRLTRIPAPVLSQVTASELFADLHKLYPQPSIRFLLPAAVPSLYIDRSLVEQLLINLINNAREATASVADPQIVVECRRVPTGSVSLSVSDNGQGILPEVIDRIFIPFFTTKPTGSGIGLSLCKQIAALHRASLTVESTIGQGSRFQLILEKP